MKTRGLAIAALALFTASTTGVMVAQYFETDPPTARFSYDGRSLTAFIQRSGSGARYGGNNVSYWEHQGEASVVWFGRTMKCTTH